MCRYGTHRADSPTSDESPTTEDGGGSEGPDDDTPTDTAVDTPRLTDDQYSEWRRWIVEAFGTADYGVVPVDHLAERIVEREPEDMDRSAVRAALTETVLPQLDRERVLDYDAERDVLINYTNRS